MRLFSVVIALSVIITLPSFSQMNERGLPFINNFSPKDYNADTQNWAVIQDNRGVMYFGNNLGILEYDGVNWNLIPVSNNSVVRSMAIDDKGVIYVGAAGEFGYLASGEQGQMEYHSLTHKIMDKGISFSDIWTTLVKNDEVYFQASNMLFRYKNGNVTILPLKNSYHRSFLIDKKLYLRQDSIGLVVLKNDSFIPVEGGKIFADKYIAAMLPFNDNILIGTRDNGLFILNRKEKVVQPFHSPINRFLAQRDIYHGLALPDKKFAFATLQDGVVIMDKEGKLQLHIQERAGLQSSNSYYLFLDKFKSLWITGAKGIAKAEINSPVSVFDKTLGLKGEILSIKRFKGRLYAGTHEGLFFLNDKGFFEEISDVKMQAWEIQEVDFPHGRSKLIVASSGGLYEINEDSAVKIYNGKIYSLAVCPLSAGRLFLGLMGDLVAIKYENGKWTEEGEINLPEDDIRDIQLDNSGNLWLSSIYKGTFRIKIKDWDKYLSGNDVLPEKLIKSCGTASGLPSLNWNNFNLIGNELLVATKKGIYRYNEKEDLFEAHEEINKAFNGQERFFYYIKSDGNGNLWFDSDHGKGLLIRGHDGYILVDHYLKRIIHSPQTSATGYTDKDGTLWFGTSDGLFRYNSKGKVSKYNFNVLLRKITIGEDSVIYKGTPFRPLIKDSIITSGLPHGNAQKYNINYLNNSISFEYAAPVVENQIGNEYAVYLEGYDKQWSDWKRETKKEYTNLSEGNYTFKVKAKNLYDVISTEATLPFTILPPWYRTWYAYGLYLIMFCGFIALVVKAYSKKLKKDNLMLEAIVQSRTNEINKQKEEIVRQKNEVELSYMNVTTLSRIGQDITSTLDPKSIINILYKSIKGLMDAESFAIGFYNKQAQQLNFKNAIEFGKELPPFFLPLTAEDKMAVWCFKNQKEVFINNMEKEYTDYIPMRSKIPAAGKHGSLSIMYVPLKIKNKITGVITVQCFYKNAYQPFHLDVLRTLAAYAAIAFDNSYAYQKLNEINDELTATLQDLKQAQAQLVQSEKMASLGQLTAGVAHEINNPVNFISAGVDSLSANFLDLKELVKKYSALQFNGNNNSLLREIEKLRNVYDLDYLLDEIPQLLESVRSGASRTKEIVKSLRNFSRLDEDDLKQANINEGLESTLTILRGQIPRGTEVFKKYGDIPVLNCYPGQLNQVFMNILVNAIQAIEGNGKICIETLCRGNNLVISIKDTGKGMTSEQLQQIFEPFYTTKEIGEGTGLGLSISYGIIEKHKGKITVKSEPGAGTEFSIHLPIH